MGIADFYSVIKEKTPGALTPVHMSMLAGQNVAVDISIFLNKFVKTAGPGRWIDSFIILLCSLKKHGIKPVCIFDGPKPPPEKRAEQDRRRAEAAKKQERINYGKRLIKKIETEYIINRRDADETIIEEVKALIGRGRSIDTINYSDIYDVLAGLKDTVSKQEKQNMPILPEYSVKAKEIIECMGFAHFQAEGEAETLCAGMCCLGLVDAVLSEDTDVLAYGTPYLLSKIDLTTDTVTVVSHQAILEGLNFTHEEFLDMCILLGCDYNDRVKGYVPDGKKRKKPAAIGAKGAVIMIEEYRRLETAEQYMEDSDPLNYRRCRELFTPPALLPNISVPINKPIDVERLEIFLRVNKARTGMEYITQCWKPTELVFNSVNDDLDMSETNEEDELEFDDESEANNDDDEDLKIFEKPKSF